MPALHPHPESPPLAVESVEAQLIRLPGKGALMARYRITGIGRLVIPEFTGRGREDDLWKHSCGEVFLIGEGDRYREFNFSPSGRWAAWDFAAYRKRAGDHDPFDIPEINIRTGDTMAVLDAKLDPREIGDFTRAGLSMVIEEEGGHLSYWSLAHPGARPDFHHPDGFTFDIPEAMRA